MNELKQVVYKTIFETWRCQVDWFWQRNNYFAAFEIGALAGCWYVVEHSHPWLGLVLAVAGLASTLAWFVTSIVTHRYADYWRESIQHIEHELALKDFGCDFMTKNPRTRLPWVHAIPVFFMLAWIAIFVFAIHCLRSGCVPRTL
jgi:hypothetical protein